MSSSSLYPLDRVVPDHISITTRTEGRIPVLTASTDRDTSSDAKTALAKAIATTLYVNTVDDFPRNWEPCLIIQDGQTGMTMTTCRAKYVRSTSTVKEIHQVATGTARVVHYADNPWLTGLEYRPSEESQGGDGGASTKENDKVEGVFLEAFA